MTPHAVLFDLDGTLVDTAEDLAWALSRTLDGLGRHAVSSAEVRGMIGGGIEELLRQGLAATGGAIVGAEFAKAVDDCRQLYNDHVADRSRPYDGVEEALPALTAAGLRLGVCTNKPEGASRRLLAALGLDDWLPVVVGGDSLDVRKPDPATARAALDLLAATPETALLVGDSVTDVALARAAGLPVVLVDYGYSQEPVETLGADAVISTLTALPEHFAALS